jgi:DNA-binding GntR family transcriptional regulator
MAVMFTEAESARPMSLNPRPALTKSAYVYEELRRRVLTGELIQGQTLSQEQLASELGVSTTPMREALRRLAAEGLVTIDAHKDARVTSLNAEEARSLFEIREQLDPLAAKLAAERRTDVDREAISAALENVEPLGGSGDLDSLLNHRAFHRSIYNASYNAPLVNLLEGLWDKTDRYRRLSLETHPDSAADRERVRREHTMIAEAVIAGDARTAEKTMRKHVQGSRGRHVIDVFES